MWEPNPEYRPDLRDLSQHPWVLYTKSSKHDFLKEIGVSFDEEMKIEEEETKPDTNMQVDEESDDES